MIDEDNDLELYALSHRQSVQLASHGQQVNPSSARDQTCSGVLYRLYSLQ